MSRNAKYPIHGLLVVLGQQTGGDTCVEDEHSEFQRRASGICPFIALDLYSQVA
jgi:hypothetical protein